MGHIAFSPVVISDGSKGWYGLGPISALPQNQNADIGSAPILRGLDRIKQLDARGCVLVGKLGYHNRFGFKECYWFACKGIPSEKLLVICFGEERPTGTMTFHPGFFV